MSRETQLLMTETNTPEMEHRVLRDARTVLRKRGLTAVFEHGQWWVEHSPSGAQWAVNDTNIGLFDFEQVTQGEES